jgi:CRP-like cAMP-binding protein/general stress protein 26
MKNPPPGGHVSHLGADAANYLTGQRILTLATASGTGLPHAAMFCYVNDKWTFYVWTHTGNMTIRNIDANPAVSLTVGEYPLGSERASGVQATGQATVVLDPAEIRQVHHLFVEKFPGLLPDQLRDLLFLRIRLADLAFVSNETEDRPPTDFSRDPVYSVFSALPQEQADTIAARLGQVTMPAGTTIVRQGAPAEKFFIIVDGRVEVVREHDGSEQVVATLGPAQFFGEVAILRDMPRTATVRAITRVSLLTMDDETFRSLVAQSLGVTRDFDEIIQARISGLARSSR